MNLAGDVLLAGLVRHKRRGRTLPLVATTMGLCMIPVSVIGKLWGLGAVPVAMSAAAAFLNVQLIAWFQQRVERAVMGRVMSVLMFSSIGLMPVSLAVVGFAIKLSLVGMFVAGGWCCW